MGFVQTKQLEMSDFTVAGQGVYLCKIKDAKSHTSQTGNKGYAIEFKILEPEEYNGLEFTDYQCGDFGMKRFKDLAKCLGFETDPEIQQAIRKGEFEGKVAVGRQRNKQRTEKNYPRYNHFFGRKNEYEEQLKELPFPYLPHECLDGKEEAEEAETKPKVSKPAASKPTQAETKPKVSKPVAEEDASPAGDDDLDAAFA